MLKVAIMPSDSAGCAYYRLWSPLTRLAQRGEIEIISRLGHNPDGHPLRYLRSEDVEGADVVILQKCGDEDWFPLAEEFGHKFIFEIDDDLGAMTKENPSYSEELARRPGLLDRMYRLMRMCAAVTVTTPHLATVIRKRHDTIRVVPNGVDLDLWRCGTEGLVGLPEDIISGDAPESEGDRMAPPVPPVHSEPLRIGYLASRNHVEDVRLLIKPFRAIAAKYPNVTFVLGGAFYPDLKRALGDRLEFHEWVDVDRYPTWARSLRLDIGVAPLVNSVFARSKSPLKWMEYAALGIPTVASDVEPYRSAIVGAYDLGGCPGCLCRDSDGWVGFLDDLIRRPDMRKQIAADALRAITARHTIDHSADAWLSVLNEVSQSSREHIAAQTVVPEVEPAHA